METISLLVGVVLAGQGGPARLPEDWPLKILDAPRAEVHRMLGKPTGPPMSDREPVLIDHHEVRAFADLVIAYRSGRVREVLIEFPTAPKDWREALTRAGLSARRLSSARARRQANGSVFLVEGVQGVKKGWEVVYTPARTVLEMGVPRDDFARLEFLAPGHRAR